MDGNANLKQWRTLISSITFMFFFSFLCNQNGISVISETEDNAVGNVQFGAFPVFVVDGTPSPLKSQARIARFFRGSGIDLSGLPVVEEGVSVERNAEFSRRVQECVELLELLGIPVLKAREEAEALCAQLNSEGHVDACITADSDAFLFGAKCVIKCLRPNCKGQNTNLCKKGG